jgi:hypothetical protein
MTPAAASTAAVAAHLLPAARSAAQPSNNLLQVTQVLSALSLVPRDGVTSSCNRAAEVLCEQLQDVDTVRCARLAAAAAAAAHAERLNI